MTDFNGIYEKIDALQQDLVKHGDRIDEIMAKQQVFEDAIGKILVLAKRGIEATEFGMPRASIQHFEWIIAACGEAGYRIKETE